MKQITMPLDDYEVELKNQYYSGKESVFSEIIEPMLLISKRDILRIEVSQDVREMAGNYTPYQQKVLTVLFDLLK
jgi:hypothetical protein